MKIDISKALEVLKANEQLSNKYVSIQVELEQHEHEKDPKLTWKLYAYSKDGSLNAWSEASPSFAEAMKSLLAQLQTEETFIEA